MTEKTKILFDIEELIKSYLDKDTPKFGKITFVYQNSKILDIDYNERLRCNDLS